MLPSESTRVVREISVSSTRAASTAATVERVIVFDASMTDYYITKHYADEWLKRTNLDFVILQPVTLTNDEEVTSIQLTKPNEKASKTITRSTVAAVLAALVEETDIS